MIHYHHEGSQDCKHADLQKTVDIDVLAVAGGLVHEHNMPCAVFPTEHAILKDGRLFDPSWKAQACGYRLVKVRRKRAWLWNLIGKYIFEDFKEIDGKQLFDEKEIEAEIIRKFEEAQCSPDQAQ
jgi:hypothetical protein